MQHVERLVGIEPIFERLEELGKLSMDWDGYDGDPPTARATATAGRLIVAAAERLGACSDGRTVPYEVMPIADGGLQLEWRGCAERAELNVGPTGAISFLHVTEVRDERKCREGDDLPWAEVLALIERVVRA
jgi:hypothetical protein